MKIGFDIHGVIDSDPKLYSKIIAECNELGYEIHILTGTRINDELMKEIDSWNINFNYLFSILDHHTVKGTKMWEDENGNSWISDEDWNKTKAIYCEENNIDFHLDDTKIYGKYFKTPFAHITPVRGTDKRFIEIRDNDDKEKVSLFLDLFRKHSIFEFRKLESYE